MKSQVEKALDKQHKFLMECRRVSLRRLRKFHQKAFQNTPFMVSPLPKGWNRDKIEKRLFYLFCLKNPHHPPGKARAAFVKKARAYLISDKPQPDELRLLLASPNPDPKLVDQYLAKFGIVADHSLPVLTRREILREIQNVKVHSSFSSPITSKEAILLSPHIHTWKEFKARYGNLISFGQETWKITRYRLRKKGLLYNHKMNLEALTKWFSSYLIAYTGCDWGDGGDWFWVQTNEKVPGHH